MLATLPILASLATLAAADFKLYWYSENTFDPTVGAASYGGIKFLTNPPNCDDFINAKQMGVDFDGDVSDPSRGGYTCDGCPSNVNWEGWRPERIEINDFNNYIFTSPPYHITLYADGDPSYNVLDTDGNKIGECDIILENRQTVNCGSPFGPYSGLEAFNCRTPDLSV